jgi:hypothetical protein
MAEANIEGADSIAEDLRGEDNAEQDIALIIAIGVAPNPMWQGRAAEDMERLYRFYFEKLKGVYTIIYAIDQSWDNYHLWKRGRKEILESIYNPGNDDNALYIAPILDKLPYEDTGDICKDYELQRQAYGLGSLQAFGNTCPIEEGSIWKKLANAARTASRVYIYNAAWEDQKGECILVKNKLFENTCGLAAVANVNPRTFILTGGITSDTFRIKEQVLRDKSVSRQSVHGDLYQTPMPGEFNRVRYLTPEEVSENRRKADQAIEKAMRIKGGRKRTRKGLKKRRATRRWKRRS